MKKMTVTVSLLALFYGLGDGRTVQAQSSSLRNASDSSMYDSMEWVRRQQASAIPRLSDFQQGTQAPPEQTALRQLPESILNVELESVSGERFKLSDYSGKVLVQNLWATWCGPCRLETPVLVKLQEEFRSQGVRMVELSTEDREASFQNVRDWVRNFGVDYRVGWVSSDMASILMQGRDAIPQAFVISGQGRIIKRFIGFSASKTPSQMKEAIEEALKVTNP